MPTETQQLREWGVRRIHARQHLVAKYGGDNLKDAPEPLTDYKDVRERPLFTRMHAAMIR